MNAKTVTAIVVGAGQRGYGYASFALDFPERLKVSVVAAVLLKLNMFENSRRALSIDDMYYMRTKIMTI